jgi:hypothetical protein
MVYLKAGQLSQRRGIKRKSCEVLQVPYLSPHMQDVPQPRYRGATQFWLFYMCHLNGVFGDEAMISATKNST